jgi:hypothetical protein
MTASRVFLGSSDVPIVQDFAQLDRVRGSDRAKSGEPISGTAVAVLVMSDV